MVSFATARASEIQDALQLQELEVNNRGFLSRFIEAKSKAEGLPNWAFTAWTSSNVLAGSDTTAILLRTILYHLLKYPASLQQLLAELQDAADKGQLSDMVSWSEAKDLPFLDACIKEAGRLRPPFGLQLERVVPAEGAEICGKHSDGGTVVGINAWVSHRNRSVFGEDAGTWRPSIAP